MSTLRTLTVAATLLAASGTATASDHLPDEELPPIESAEWMCDVIIWIATTFGPNIPTEASSAGSVVRTLDDGRTVHLVAQDADSWAFDTWSGADYSLDHDGYELAAAESVTYSGEPHQLDDVVVWLTGATATDDRVSVELDLDCTDGTETVMVHVLDVDGGMRAYMVKSDGPCTGGSALGL